MARRDRHRRPSPASGAAAALALALLGAAWSCAGAPSGMPSGEEAVARQTFTNPIVSSRPAGDPWVIRHGDLYYFTATIEPEGGLWVWSSPTLTGLDSGAKVKVWTAPEDGPMSSQIWAPELHRLRGKWYLYFTASDGVDSNHRHYVLEAVGDDPQGEYLPPVRVDPGLESYAIDGSVLEMPDGRLFWMYTAGGLFIAPMESPTSVTGPRVRFAAGTEEWERGWRRDGEEWVRADGHWIEAPQALIRDGRVFVVYSAGHTATKHYYLGLLSLSGSDPMDAAAWRKHPGPVFAPYEGPDGRVDTPGHNSFTRSPDGTEDWLVYHARDHAPPPGLRAAERTVRIQPFGWSDEGLPEFGHPIPPGVPIPRPSGE